MQQDQFEVLFCDLCGTSVPLLDLERGTAIRHLGKTIGACCLAVVRNGVSPLASSTPGGPASSVERAPGGEGRLMPVAIVVLAALAAVAIFLDQKTAGVDTAMRANHEQVATTLRSHGDVLQALGMAMDGAARKADLDALGERLGGIDAALQAGNEQARQQLDAMRQAVTSVQQGVAATNERVIDYRPMFDELRQHLQRQAVTLAELKARAAAPAPVEGPAPNAPPVVEQPAAQGLPDNLAQQVKRLAETDPALRFEAVDELLRSKNMLVLPHLLPMARDPDAFVRRLTIEGLRDFKHVDAVEALLAALGDADENVRDTAWRSLKELTGQKIPFEAPASKDARARAQQRWQEWWEKNKATFGS
jgi:hypothetical protein